MGPFECTGQLRLKRIGRTYSELAVPLVFVCLFARAVNVDAAPSAGTDADSSSPSTGINEVIVSARKISERLEDVPVALSVVDTDTMVQQNSLSLQDYYTSVPGLSISDQGNGRLSITMRGLSSGINGNPTVGITIDDVPIGATDTAIIVGAQFVPELDPADLQRIEFLKGPQGTLYGASSLAGVMRYVTVAPDLRLTSGHVDLDGSAIPGGALGYGLRGSINLPLIADTLGVRVSAFGRHDPGYVDDPFHGMTNLNGIDVYGGHLTALLQAAQNISIRLSALLQRTEGKGDGTIDTDYLFHPIGGQFDQNRLPNTGRYDYDNQLYSASINLHWNSFDIASITGYGVIRDHEIQDITPAFGALAFQFYGVDGSSVLNRFESNKWTQEVRVSSRAGARFEWQIGGFYTKEDNGPNSQQDIANDLLTGTPAGNYDPATGEPAGSYEDLKFPAKYEEYAGFVNLTYHFTDQFNLQLGARQSHNSQKYRLDFSGVGIGPEPYLADFASSGNAFTYLVSPQFRLDESTMLYARVASGYQAGGPNTVTPDTPAPTQFDPSKTTNYELGIKARLLDRRLSIDADVFYVDWSKIQLVAFTPDFISYVFNGGKAKSEGIEIATEFKPIDSITLSASAAYTDAKLTNDAGNGFPGQNGDPLPFSSRFSGNVSAEERFAFGASVTGFAGVTAAYVGKRHEGFPANPGQPEPSIPGYGYGNLRAGIETGGFTLTAFVKNITNERGVLSSFQYTGSTPDSGVWHTAIITPRTLGLSLSKAFRATTR